ncbi:MAG: hypothetical protein KKA07_17885, partial [Bacteroidetes bacterium]|nr:hypothetical protein [Bacteroidota bacterium]
MRIIRKYAALFRSLPRSGKYLLVISALMISGYSATTCSSTFGAIGDGKYAFFHDDEFNYYAAAKVFYETGSVKAPLCFMEDVAPVTGTSWYGPLYHILYGSLMRITGFHEHYFIIFNMVFLLLLGLLIAKFRIRKSDRITILALLAFSYPLLVYPLMFFPEIWILLMSAGLIWLLIRISNEDNQKIRIRLLIFYSVLAVVFVLFRITGVFWLFGLFPFAKTRKEKLVIGSILAGGLVFTMLYMKYFTAPAFVMNMSVIGYLAEMDGPMAWIALTENISENLSTLFFITLKDPAAIMLLFLFAFAVIRAAFSRNKLLIAALLISALYFSAIICIYVAYPFHFIKQTAVLLPLLITALVVSEKRKGNLAVLFVLPLIFFPWNVSEAKRETQLRKTAWEDVWIEHPDRRNDVEKIAAFFDDEQPVVVEFIHYEHAMPKHVFYHALPLSTTKGAPITWTASIYSRNLFPDMPYEERFVKYDKL